MGKVEESHVEERSLGSGRILSRAAGQTRVKQSFGGWGHPFFLLLSLVSSACNLRAFTLLHTTRLNFIAIFLTVIIFKTVKFFKTVMCYESKPQKLGNKERFNNNGLN